MPESRVGAGAAREGVVRKARDSRALSGSTRSDGRWLGPVGNQEWTLFSPVARLLNQVRELDWDTVSLSTRGGILMLGSGSSLGQEVGQALCFSHLLVQALA